MPHVVLLGDSILDNGAYVCGGSPVVEQLRSRLPRQWRVTLLARDGAIASDVVRQVGQLPADATHLVVSAGGNDALGSTPILNSPAPDSASLLSELVAAHREFEDNYRRMIGRLRARQLPIVACTIYDAVPGLKPAERMGLSLFNDIILRECIAVHMPLLDLRRVCDDPCDYSSVSPIEPSEIGGDKIARSLQQVLLFHDFSEPRTVVYP